MSAGAVVGTSINIFGVGLVFGLMAIIVDTVRHQSQAATMAASQVMLMDQITYIFIAAAFSFFLAAIIHHIIVSKNEMTGMV